MAAGHCIAAVEAAVGSDYATGVKREWQLFQDLAASPYAKALQYAFFAERRAGDIPDLGPDVKPRPVGAVGIIGAGTMGTGIALAFLNADVPVTLVDASEPALERGAKRIRETIASNVARGRISAEQGERRLSLLTPSLSFERLAGADFIIEAVFEKLALKRDIFGKLDHIAKPGAVLASNTSTLDVDQIAAATPRPADVVGTHFFSPANIMRLLEIVRAKETAKDALATAMALAKRIGKVGVVSRRLLRLHRQSHAGGVSRGGAGADARRRLARRGRRRTRGLGPRHGAQRDDGSRRHRRRLHDPPRAHVFRRAHAASIATTDRISEMGRHGQKTGAGYYQYGADRKRVADPAVDELFAEEAATLGVTRRRHDRRRSSSAACCGSSMRAPRVLDEGIALRASDIDTIYLTGYGFPAWRGGPMWQAENVWGLAGVADKIRNYEAKYGARWSLAPKLAHLAASGKGWDG